MDEYREKLHGLQDGRVPQEEVDDHEPGKEAEKYDLHSSTAVVERPGAAIVAAYCNRIKQIVIKERLLACIL